jgi:hypothetical protein
MPLNALRTVARALGWGWRVALLAVLFPVVAGGALLLLLYGWATWPVYPWLGQRPFDPAAWRDAAPGRGRDARFWMADDLRRRLRGKSRAEVVGLLGEPDRDTPLSYVLAPMGWFGRWEVLIRLDERGRVKGTRVARRLPPGS